MLKSRIAKFLLGTFILIGSATSAQSTDLPANDPALFSYLFVQKTIPAEWISEPAIDELTSAMLNEIAVKLSREGGEYQNATKTARGWVLEFQNGSVRARIVRAMNRKIVGVFFSRLE